jgi:HPt (histidine-containing phosphotransfer) domain-containing protein
MMALLSASDFEGLARLAHDMKGTGSAYGFPELTRMGAGLEYSTKQMDTEALSPQLAELMDYLSKVQLIAQVSARKTSSISLEA